MKCSHLRRVPLWGIANCSGNDERPTGRKQANRRDKAFRNLCESLEQDDPTCTDARIRDPLGYGRRLGEALSNNNTNVSNLSLHLSSFIARGETSMESAAPLILFIRNSASLRHVRLIDFDLIGRMLSVLGSHPTLLKLSVGG
jgi:hypothetical protein